MTNQKKSPITLSQLIWGSLAIILLVSGFVLALLGFLRDLLNLPYDQNWIRIAENAMNEFLSTNFSWQIWGSLFMVLGALIFTLLMQRLATEEEKQIEKSLRRAQRLQDAKITK
ncbi:MAG: hypothetical protein ACO22H_00230 [Bacilli bacterium]